MYSGATVFSQLMQQLPWWRFQTFVDRYQDDYKVKTFRCVQNFRVMNFAQLTYRESFRDIEACLRAMEPKITWAFTAPEQISYVFFHYLIDPENADFQAASYLHGSL